MLVDDDPIITAGTGSDLEEKGYEVTTANSGEKAIELLDNTAFDLVITDLTMSPIDGIGVLKRAKEIRPETMVIIFTGFGDWNSMIEALRLAADDYILKPCEPEEMYFRISKCIEKMELRRKVKIYEDILPVCCVCKKIRDDTGKKPGTLKWIQIENYIRDRGKIEVTSTCCPNCSKKVKEEPA